MNNFKRIRTIYNGYKYVSNNGAYIIERNDEGSWSLSNDERILIGCYSTAKKAKEEALKRMI